MSVQPDILAANSGKAHKKAGASLQTFLASLVVSVIIFAAEILLFLVARKKLLHVYQPRKNSELGSPKLSDIFTISIVSTSCVGLDGYFFQRYLLFLLRFFSLMAILILPTLLPLNYIGGRNGRDVRGLDRFAWPNIAHEQRYWAHLTLAVLLVAVFCYMFYYELRHYIWSRQIYLSCSKQTTVLINEIPKDMLNTCKLAEMYNIFPGGIKNIWINRDYCHLQKKVDERKDIVHRLEKAETRIIVMATRKHQELQRHSMRLPLHSKLPSLPLLGEKIDTIQYLRKDLERLNSEIKKDQEKCQYPLLGSAFIQFNRQLAAHMASRTVLHNVPQQMRLHIVASPNDVIWKNIGMRWWTRYIWVSLNLVGTGLLVIGWAFPVALFGSVAQISYLTSTFSWLQWVLKVPDSLLGLLSGVLPSLSLSIIMAVLPQVLRILANMQGLTTKMAVEKSVQGSYFACLFIQVFLVVSVSSGITTVIEDISLEPIHAAKILATNLPKSSNFFFSYLLVEAFTISGATLLQISTLFTNYVISPIIDKTPRQKFNRATTPSEIQWGTLLPVYTNMACISIVYSVISPLVLVFNVIVLYLFWIIYKYNFLFVVNFQMDMGGLLFPRAMNQLFTGLYVMEITLIGLFLLERDSQMQFICWPQAVIMIITTAMSALFQCMLNHIIGPLFMYLPCTAVEEYTASADSEFKHPALGEKIPTIWIPHDDLGVSQNEILQSNSRISISDKHAKVDSAGNVSYTGPPPDLGF